MSSKWRAEQEIQAALRKAGVMSERQRQAQEAALKREQEHAAIQADIVREIEEKEKKYREKQKAEENARLEAEAIEKERIQREKDAQDKVRRDAEAIALAEENAAQEKARREGEAAAAVLKAKLQEEKDSKDLKSKRKEGWVDTELRLLQRLKLLARSLEDSTTVTDVALEETARSLFQQKLTIDTGIENRRELYRAFSWGAASGNTVLIRLLALDANVQRQLLYQTEECDLTPFQLAAQNGHLEVISLMLEVIPAAKDPNSNHHALNLAITNGHQDVAKMLLEDARVPINLDQSDAEGFTPLHHAVQKGLLEVVKLIPPASEYEYQVEWFQGDPNNRALHLAAASGHESILDYLLNMGSDPNAKDSDGSTPLFKAIENGHLEAVKALLSNSRVEINIVNNAGNTPLFAAFARGQLHLAQYLFDREDLDVNATNSQGWTVLMLAASFGCTLSVSKLLQHAEINVEYSVETTELLWGSLPVTKKWSALDISQAKGFRQLEQILSIFSSNEPSIYRESPRKFKRDPNAVGDHSSRVDYPAAGTAWSEWVWNDEHNCDYRYRRDATGRALSLILRRIKLTWSRRMAL
jgi:ankyrin repeat protein